MKTGKVQTQNGIRSVNYWFFDNDTIECIDIITGQRFYTHYKSLIV